MHRERSRSPIDRNKQGGLGIAHFYGTIQGSRGEASRIGSGASGLHARAQGWHIGASIYALVDVDGKDRVRVNITLGSSGPEAEVCLGFFSEDDLRALKGADISILIRRYIDERKEN
jgi:hypothetical protein